jgi:hypothetical protein
MFFALGKLVGAINFHTLLGFLGGEPFGRSLQFRVQVFNWEAKEFFGA